MLTNHRDLRLGLALLVLYTFPPAAATSRSTWGCPAAAYCHWVGQSPSKCGTGQVDHLTEQISPECSSGEAELGMGQKCDPVCIFLVQTVCVR